MQITPLEERHIWALYRDFKCHPSAVAFSTFCYCKSATWFLQRKNIEWKWIEEASSLKISVIKIWHFFCILIHFKPSYQLDFLLPIFGLNASAKITDLLSARFRWCGEWGEVSCHFVGTGNRPQWKYANLKSVAITIRRNYNTFILRTLIEEKHDGQATKTNK